jgi:flavodoxin
MAEKRLVAVFSASGVTKGVGEEIARVADADFYEIVPKDIYTSEDLDWMNPKSRSSVEMNNPAARPKIGGEPLNMACYDTVIIGYPIWWGDAPRIMDTFVESHDFTGMTVIPFCTSASSGAGASGETLGALAGTGTFLPATRFGASVSESALQTWLEGLNA